MQIIRAIILAVIVTALGDLESAEAARLSGKHDGAKANYSYSVVRDFSRVGKRSQRFEVRAGDCRFDRSWSGCGSAEGARERSEYEPSKRWRFGQDQWIGFSVFLPSDFNTSNQVPTTVGRVSITDDDGPPLMHLEMRGNSYYMHVWRTRNDAEDLPIARVSDMRGRWTDIALHLDTSEGNRLLEVYVNRRQQSKIENWREFGGRSEFIFGYGILRDRGTMPTQVLFIDEARMGRSPEKIIIDEKRPVD